jgi:hypothetical protein
MELQVTGAGFPGVNGTYRPIKEERFPKSEFLAWLHESGDHVLYYSPGTPMTVNSGLSKGWHIGAHDFDLERALYCSSTVYEKPDGADAWVFNPMGIGSDKSSDKRWTGGDLAAAAQPPSVQRFGSCEKFELADLLAGADVPPALSFPSADCATCAESFVHATVDLRTEDEQVAQGGSSHYLSTNDYSGKGAVFTSVGGPCTGDLAPAGEPTVGVFKWGMDGWGHDHNGQPEEERSYNSFLCKRNGEGIWQVVKTMYPPGYEKKVVV